MDEFKCVLKQQSGAHMNTEGGFLSCDHSSCSYLNLTYTKSISWFDLLKTNKDRRTDYDKYNLFQYSYST